MRSKLGFILLISLYYSFQTPSWAMDPTVSYIKEVTEGITSHHLKAELTRQNPKKPTEDDRLRVVQYLGTEPETVMINGGKDKGIVDGTIFAAYRSAMIPGSKKRVWVPTGKLKAIEVAYNYTVAEILAGGSKAAQSFFKKHARVMAGDFLREQPFVIQKNPQITPETVLEYRQLFVDPKKDPVSFELTIEGKELLRDMIKPYLELRVPILMVEGHTDDEGAQDANQVESYQRAMTVRQFLIEEMQLRSERVVAIGFGESQPLNRSKVGDYKETNRRIVFKVVSH